MNSLILIFEGTDGQAEILKHQLQNAEIPALLRSETRAAHIAGFGTPDSCSVFVNPSDAETANQIVQGFNF